MLRNGIENFESNIGLHSEQGKKAYQEDRVVGAKSLVSGINLLMPEVQNAIIKDHFRQMQKQYCDYQKVGSTACVATAWIGPDAHVLRLVAASLGDSHAHLLLVDKNTGKVKHYEQLTSPHKPENPEEFARITSAGGLVSKNRLNGRLAMSRAFGDNQYDDSGISHEPDVSFLEYELADDEEAYVVVASDGLDRLGIGNYVEAIEEIYYKHQIKHLQYTFAARALVRAAINDYKSGDNCSAAVFCVRDEPLSAAVFDGHGGDDVSTYLETFFYAEFYKHIQCALQTEAQQSAAYGADTESDDGNEVQDPSDSPRSEASTSNYATTSSALFTAVSAAVSSATDMLLNNHFLK